MVHLFYGNNGLVAWVRTNKGRLAARWFRDLPTKRKLADAAEQAVFSPQAEVTIDGETFEIIRERDADFHG